AIKTAAEQMEIDVALARDAAVKTRLEKRVADWRAEVERYQSEPKGNSKGEGRKELMQRALAAEKERDVYTEKYHAFEIGSAAFQIAIVMASVYLLTHLSMLLWMAAGLCGLGVMFSIIGLVNPHVMSTLFGGH
ncbi:MAG: DUF4337 family protein, partial [Hyphomicrobiaceae bacterium]|nr:DUF4337 family protein [Hyphomicrobiaceae bacterium]